MKIYIAGKITGLTEEEYTEKFSNATLVLMDNGVTVVNPVIICSGLDESNTWKEYMDICLFNLIRCDSIYMLNNWFDSKGARVEYAVAKELGLKIMSEE